MRTGISITISADDRKQFQANVLNAIGARGDQSAEDPDAFVLDGCAQQRRCRFECFHAEMDILFRGVLELIALPAGDGLHRRRKRRHEVWQMAGQRRPVQRAIALATVSAAT